MKKWLFSLLMILMALLFIAADAPSSNGIKLRNEVVWLSNDTLAFSMLKVNQQQLIKFNINTSEMECLITRENSAVNTNINLRISDNRKYLLWQFGQELNRYSLVDQHCNKFSLEKTAIQPDINRQGDIIFSFYGQIGLYYLREVKSFSFIYPGFCSIQRFSRNGKYIALVNQERFTILDAVKQNIYAQQSIIDLSNRLEWSPNNDKLLLTINPFAHGDFPDTSMAVYQLADKKLITFETDDYIVFVNWYDQTKLICIRKPKLNDLEKQYIIKFISLNNKIEKDILSYSKPIAFLSVSPDAQRVAFISREENKLLVYNFKKEVFDVEYLIQ